ncbi:MAG: Bug family tripartite tricarboxylate transporter substrate binding protein [Hyphomicrobiaceae bacterium]
MRLLIKVVLTFLLGTASLPALAETYPSRPIKFVLPFGAGSASDALARIMATELTKSMGQPVIVVPRPGANGSLSAIEVMRAAPDGYTLLFGTNSPLAVVPNLMKTPPYDVMEAFTPITFLGENTFFLAATPSVPANSLKEFIAYAKANPKTLNYASGNTFAIVGTQLFVDAAGIDMLHVPYKTEPDAIVDVLAGRVHLMFGTSTTVLPHAAAGKLKVLATTLGERSALLPDVPTMIEQGQPKLPVVAWFGLVGPAKLPTDIVGRINKEMTAVLANPTVRKQLQAQGFSPRSSTPDELKAYMIEQLAVWKSAIKAAGIPQQ